MQEVFLKDLADVDHHIQEKCWHVFPAFNRSKRYKIVTSIQFAQGPCSQHFVPTSRTRKSFRSNGAMHMNSHRRRGLQHALCVTVLKVWRSAPLPKPKRSCMSRTARRVSREDFMRSATICRHGDAERQNFAVSGAQVAA